MYKICGMTKANQISACGKDEIFFIPLNELTGWIINVVLKKS